MTRYLVRPDGGNHRQAAQRAILPRLHHPRIESISVRRGGFRRHIQDYFDPRNSFLNDVLEPKLGIPISLAVIYLEVGQRLGLPLVGVSFPGHFLVKLTVRTGDVVLDPFLGGQSLSPEDL
jgi:regulator of sirC expression with transglutaminase-like and TPR domain